MLAAVLVSLMSGGGISALSVVTPGQGQTFYPDAIISVSGSGATVSTPVDADNNGSTEITESSGTAFSNANGSFSFTVEPPASGWIIDGANTNHKVEVINITATATVTIKIIEKPGGDGPGGGVSPPPLP